MGERFRGRILVVGDDAGFSSTIADALFRLGHKTVTSTPADLADAARRCCPDVVVLVAETVTPASAARDARSLGQLGAPFLYVLHSDRLADRLAAFEAGADDVMARPVAIPELAARLQVVLRRHGGEADAIELGGLIVDLRAHDVTWNRTPLDLTSLEFNLLVMFLRHRGSVLSKAQLLGEVWGFDRHDENVVEVHVSALRRKLERVGPRLIHTVRGAGYVLRPPEPDRSVHLVVG